MRNIVVLPQPLGPNRMTTSPGPMRRSRGWTTVVPSKVFETPWNSSMSLSGGRVRDREDLGLSFRDCRFVALVQPGFANEAKPQITEQSVADVVDPAMHGQ